MVVYVVVWLIAVAVTVMTTSRPHVIFVFASVVTATEPMAELCLSALRTCYHGLKAAQVVILITAFLRVVFSVLDPRKSLVIKAKVCLEVSRAGNVLALGQGHASYRRKNEVSVHFAIDLAVKISV